MKYKAHDYQQYATDFIITHPVSCLILDMGLGKTVITLTALWLLLFDYFEVRRVLVIAPKRVAETTWPTEIKKVGASLRHDICSGNGNCSTEKRSTSVRSRCDHHRKGQCFLDDKKYIF